MDPNGALPRRFLRVCGLGGLRKEIANLQAPGEKLQGFVKTEPVLERRATGPRYAGG